MKSRVPRMRILKINRTLCRANHPRNQSDKKRPLPFISVFCFSLIESVGRPASERYLKNRSPAFNFRSRETTSTQGNSFLKNSFFLVRRLPPLVPPTLEVDRERD